MPYTDSKKAFLATYEVLKKYSSEEKPLSQVKIMEYVERCYELKVSRNTMTDTLKKLREFYSEKVICCHKTERLQPGGDNTYTYGYYYNREQAKDALSDEDIAKLVDTCLYARNLTAKEAKDLICQLREMATADFKKKLDYTSDIPEKQFNMNHETSDNLRLLHQAISKNHGTGQQWVSFYFNNYNEKRQLDPSGNRHVVLPIRICEANHKYYLLCAIENRTKIYHYRVDLMSKLEYERHEMVEELNGLRKRFNTTDISEYMSRHLYMFYDEPKMIELEIPKEDGKSNLTFLVDAFGAGTSWRIQKESENAITVKISCSLKAMKIFIMQYAGKGIHVVGPEEVKKQIDASIQADCDRLLEQIRK